MRRGWMGKDWMTRGGLGKLDGIGTGKRSVGREGEVRWDEV